MSTRVPPFRTKRSFLRLHALEERAVPAAQIDFASSFVQGEEGKSVVVTAVRSGDTIHPALAGVTFIEGTAKAADYSPAGGLFEWAPGEMGEKSITIAINDDSVNESAESFTLKLYNLLPGFADDIGVGEMEVEIDRNDAAAIDAKTKLAIDDKDGDKVTVKFGGNGKAMVYLDDPDGDGKGSIDLIHVTDSDDRSTLTVSVTKVGNGLVDIGQINGDTMKSVNAAKSDLVGDGAYFSGYVGSFRFNSVLNGADTNSEADVVNKARKTTIAIQGAVGDGSDISTYTLGKLTAGSFALGSNLRANSIGAMMIRGNFSANLEVYGQGIDHAKGKNSVGSINVKGAMNDSVLSISGNVGSVLAYEFIDSQFYGGYTPGAGFDIVATKIGSFKTVANKKLGLTGKFENSTIFADTVKRATLADVVSNNAGNPIGVFVDNAYGSVTLTVNGAKSTTRNSEDFAAIGDFDVAVV